MTQIVKRDVAVDVYDIFNAGSTTNKNSTHLHCSQVEIEMSGVEFSKCE